MAKLKKKGTSGQARNYITRTQAVRKLQISLPDFRRLCIFKGIYPREPRNHKKASKSSTQATTFYYAKDIQYLLHEPLLAKFREQKALSKKIARLLGRNEFNDALRLEKHGTPKITLDHIIRERYPTFANAIRDLDDALSLLSLFANLPSTPTVPAKVISRCQRLCHEFEHYLITTNSLRKSFLSIKGIYYQATIQGQDVMWLVPYRFVQKTTHDVDYRIMGTFVEFYTTLLELGAFTIEGRGVVAALDNGDETKVIADGHAQKANSLEVQRHLDQLNQLEDPDDGKNIPQETDQEENTEAIDTFETAAPEADTLAQPGLDGRQTSSLFSDFTFYISREAPRHSIEFLLRAFGCKRVGWDPVLGDAAFTNDELDSRITHQVVDRPAIANSERVDHDDDPNPKALRPGMRIQGRTYIQPQWIWDCINEGRLLRPDLYAPGATLPPHLSPWVKSAPGQYDPRASLSQQEPEGEAERALEGSKDNEARDEEGSEVSENASANGGMETASSEEGDEQDGALDDSDFAGFDGEEPTDIASSNEEEDESSQHQKELEAEAAGLPFSSASGSGGHLERKAKSEEKRRALQKQNQKKEEELERQKMMMSNKKRKLFEKMQYSNSKRDAEAEKLRSKRRRLQQAAA